jgi:hypothetical protein
LSRRDHSFLEAPPGLAAEICRRVPPDARRLLVVGLAAGEAAARLRRDRPALRIRSAEITELEVLRRTEKRYDVLLLAGVVTEVADPFDVLASAAELALPGARLIVTAPSASCAPLVEALIGGRWPPAPLRWLTRASLRELLEESGLLRVAVEPVSGAAVSAPFLAALGQAGIAFQEEELVPLHWIATGESPAP